MKIKGLKRKIGSADLRLSGFTAQRIYPVGEAWLIKNKVSQRFNFTILYFYKILFGFSCIIEIKKLKNGFINSELHHFLNKKMSYDANILCYGHNIIC